MKLGLVGVAVAASVALCSCASHTTTVKEIAARNTSCDPSNIIVTELEPPRAGVSRYQTEGCGTAHNYTCPDWEYFAMSALTLFAMSESDEFIDIKEPSHCKRQRR